MEFEQIIKRIDWLEKEHRKNKETIASLKEQLASMDTSVGAASKQMKTLDKQFSDIGATASRLNQFEEILNKQRADLKKAIDENDKRSQKREADAAKRHQLEVEDINKSLAEMKKNFDPLDLKKKFKERTDETQGLLNNIADLKERLEDAIKTSQDLVQLQKVIDEGRKQDLKRMADIQGEFAAVRKRVDENREKTSLHSDSMRNMENRLTELLNTELERKQGQIAFLDQQTRAQVDRDRAWKDWREKYESFRKEAETLDTQVQALDETLRAAKKAQEAYLELNTKLERRINEVTEMQRLTEDRLRQEWITFKADDQKRWTGYTLSSEESMRDIRKDVQKIEGRLTALDDAAQLLQDQLHQTTDTTEKQLQEFMNVTHEWMSSYERIMGHGKAKKSANK
jgi:chromosome segregation ATPase